MMRLREQSELLRVLGHPTRLAIIARLARGPQCVTDIQELLEVRQANVSQHLAALRSSRIVDFCEDGKTRCYYISRPALAASLLRLLARDFPVVQRSPQQVRRRVARQREETNAQQRSRTARIPMDQKTHWETVYRTKGDAEVSWTQKEPTISLSLISKVCKTGQVIDVGGGTSVLADRLLDASYQVAVLDISEAAVARAKERLGARAGRIRWVVADVTAAPDLGTCDVWHDRAVFHFLSEPADRARYVKRLTRTLRSGGHAILATFAPDGPEQCSGLKVCRYDGPALAKELGAGFRLVRSLRETHVTPWGKPQSFQYSLFRHQQTP